MWRVSAFGGGCVAAKAARQAGKHAKKAKHGNQGAAAGAAGLRLPDCGSSPAGKGVKKAQKGKKGAVDDCVNPVNRGTPPTTTAPGPVKVNRATPPTARLRAGPALKAK